MGAPTTRATGASARSSAGHDDNSTLSPPNASAASAASRRIPAGPWVAALLVLGAGCAGDDPLHGAWVQPEGSTELPGGMGTLAVDATLTLDGRAEPSTFVLALALSLEPLTDRLDARGTYERDGDRLTLRFEEVASPPEAENPTRVAEDGARCVGLNGFGGAEVCFPSPQTNPYVLGDDTLAVTIDQAILGADVSQTRLALRRRP